MKININSYIIILFKSHAWSEGNSLEGYFELISITPTIYS